jgi:adenylate/nucleoside-diphosphate kinase
VPTDVHFRPIVFVIGKVKTGKTTIAKLLASTMKLVRLKVSMLLEDFIKHMLDPMAIRAKMQISSGGVVDDETIVQLLIKRTQLSDCY